MLQALPLLGAALAADAPAPKIDPGVAIGPSIRYVARPTGPDLRACSARVPVCVHARTAADGPAARDSLAAFERAWATLTGALGVPTPDVDPLTLAYDVFVEPDVESLVDTALEARDVRSRVDRARGFSRVDGRLRAGCLLDGLAAEAVARASLLRAAPGTSEGIARAQATYLAELATCASPDAALFQSRPDLAFADAHVGETAPAAGGAFSTSPSARRFASGAALFWRRLDWAFGRVPGGVVTAAWALGPSMTPLGAPRWHDEPDTFDVLRVTFKNALSSGSTVSDLWLDFGVARAFPGSTWHLPEVRDVPVPLAWDIPWPKTPRRLAPRTPVAPTGASYLVVRREGARPEARLRVEIEWEEHALFRWAFVKLAKDGSELGRVPIPTTERATSAQMTLVGLEDTDRVMLVGVNVGDPAYAFDPDDEVWEPHGWLVTLAEE